MQALTTVNPGVYESVKALCDDPNTDTIIVSGSDKPKLEEVSVLSHCHVIISRISFRV